LIFGLPAAPKIPNRMIHPLIRELSYKDFSCRASQRPEAERRTGEAKIK
jgi:hypothetical protein